MISTENLPLIEEPLDADFTVDAYRDLLILAKKHYKFASYSDIPFGQKFILWRHDCDYSLNRAYALARIEADERVRSTYFLNPHCEFYNLFEKDQHRLVKEILAMGHEIGLHYDAAFHGVSNETAFEGTIASERKLLENLYGVSLSAFSFHNPVDSHMLCDADNYAGLVNCYSQRFKKQVPYCSDSNGYWRFRRLRNVLAEATDPCLQVLTHPGWWQESAMPPRQRIFRSVYGRADFTMREYDSALGKYGRSNHAGDAKCLLFIKTANPRLFGHYDYLWNTGYVQTIFVELWRLHESQINRLCKAELRKRWRVSATELNDFFESSSFAIDGWRLFEGVFGLSWKSALDIDVSFYRALVNLRNQLILGRAWAPRKTLVEGCVFLCSVIESLTKWGTAQPIHYDGIDHLGSIGIPTYKTADGSLSDRLEEIVEETPSFSRKQWEQFKITMKITKANEGAT